MASKLRQHQVSFCIIDNQQTKVALAEKDGYAVIYGDVSDNDLLRQVITSHTQVVYSTAGDHDTNIHILTISKEVSDEIKVISLAAYLDEAEHLYDAGTDYVIFPHMSGAHESRDIIEKHIREPEEFMPQKIKNREALQVHKSHIGEG
jgi:voltage-gated potassium channel Kch